MKITSLIVLLALAGGAAYIFFVRPPWFWDRFEEGRDRVRGYSDAARPVDALELFAKAVKARDYRTAAKYCLGDYAEQLKKSHEAAYELGDMIDHVKNMMIDKGFTSANARAVLYCLDPFPKDLMFDKVTKEKDDKAVGLFKLDDPTYPRVPTKLSARIDPLMFQNALHPGPGIFTQGVELRREGEGDSKSWKLNIPLAPQRLRLIVHFRDNYKAYVTGLDNVRELIRQGRFLPANFESEMITILAQCKQSQ